MNSILLDTDTISYFLRQHPIVTENLKQYVQIHGFVSMSVITYYEVLNGLYFKDAKKQLAHFEKFVELSQVLPMNNEIAKKSAKIFSDLRKNGQIIGHNDVLIASTAIFNKMTLATNNTNHFSRIKGLKLINWTD